MSADYHGPERRAPSRPAGGDLRPCPQCGGTMRFEERLTITRGGVTERQPAWVCRNAACLYDWLVRTSARDM